MSYSDLAVSYYHRACKLESAAGCEHMVSVFEHGADAARNSSTSLTEMADALIASCTASVKGAREQLFAFGDGRDWVYARSGDAFETKCSAGTTEACYWLAKLHTHNVGRWPLGGVHERRAVPRRT